MRKFALISISAGIACCIVSGADWPSLTGNPQRDGWAKNEKAFTRENAANIELLYKVKAANQARGLWALTSPLIDGNLITYLGFKEMLVFGGSSDNVFSVDADLNRPLWKAHFDYKADKPMAAPTAVCPGGLSASVAMPGSSTAAGRGGAAAGRGRGVPGAPGAAGAPGVLLPGAPAANAGRGPAPQPGFPPQGAAGRGGLLTGGGFGRSGAFVVVSADGLLHVLNASTGADKIPPMKFLPPNSKTGGLNLNDSIIYAATQDNCTGSANAIYAMDLSGEEAKLSTFEVGGHGLAGSAGTAIGTDGTVYGLAPDGQGDSVSYNDTVLALSKDLKVKDYFTRSDESIPANKQVPLAGATPVVFQWKTKDVIVAGGRDGRLYLLDSASLGGPDHHTPLSRTEPVTGMDSKYGGNGFRGAFSSWEDAETNTRWIYAPIAGPVAAGAGVAMSNGGAPRGSVVAYKVEEQNGQPALIPAWVSRDLMAPAAPVTANGLVFVLSTGESASEAKPNGELYTIAEREKMAEHAALYVLDGTTGKELYSSGNMTTTFAHGTGVAIANRRIYFTTHDNTVYCLGFLAEQPQLTGK